MVISIFTRILSLSTIEQIKKSHGNQHLILFKNKIDKLNYSIRSKLKRYIKKR